VNPDDPAAAMPAEEPVYELTGWRRMALWPLGLLVRLWARSLRIEIAEEDLRAISKNDRPLAIVLWHNRLFLAPEIVRRYRRRAVYALVSASRDGAWLAAFFTHLGLRSVRGSSTHQGREAARALIERLRAGCDVGITPDGPKGPQYDFKAGAFIVTRRAATPVILIGARFFSAWRLRKSWDGFYLPRPFSRVHMSCTCVSAEEVRSRDMTVERLRDRLVAINPD
jgi:lysophospholipid acyltransferase (LPLAT)-like uncharacterized protein